MRRAGALPHRRAGRPSDVRGDSGSLPDAAHDPGPQLVAPGVRDGRRRAASDRRHRACEAAGEALRARHWQLAVFPRRPGGWCGGRPAAAGRLESEDGRARALADADPGPGALEPDRVGQSRVRDQRRQQRSEGDVPARALWRRRRVGRSFDAAMDAVRARRADREDPVGARGLRGRAARAASHQVDIRQRHAGHRRPHRRRVVRLAGGLRLRRRRHAPVEGRPRPPRRRRLRHPDLRVGHRELADHLERLS